MSRPLQELQRFFRELKRRNVYKVTVAYLAVAFMGIQAARMLVPPTTLPGWADEFLIYLAVFGFPVALVIAWAFEMTPEGVRRTADARAGPDRVGSESREPGPAEAPSGRLAMKAFVGLGIVAAAIAGGWYLMGSGGRPEVGERSVAVLPFEARGGRGHGAFAEGMDDALSGRLGNVSELQVSPSRAVQVYRDTALSTAEIAWELGVNWVVSGEVLETGDEIRVFVQLVDPETESQMWSETYTSELEPDELFDLQSDIATRIASSLEAELSAEEQERVRRHPTEDLDAYELYVRGRADLDGRTEEGMRRAVELFRGAIARDSSYALAWSGLADGLALLSYYGYLDPDTARPAAMNAAKRALEIAPDLAEAHASMGVLHYNAQEGPAALRELRRAVALKPSYARAYQWLGDLEGILGRPEASLAHLQEAVDLDPASPSIQSAVSWAYWWVEGPEGAALDHAREAVELEPEYAHGHEVEGLLLSAAGRQEEAIAAFQRALDLAPEASLSWAFAVGGIGTAYARSGDTVRSRKQLGRLQTLGDAPFQEARIHAALGEGDSAFAALREMEPTWVNVWALRFLPVFEPLRDDPRYESLLREMNVAWGLNPDGSVPDGVDRSADTEASE